MKCLVYILALFNAASGFNTEENLNHLEERPLDSFELELIEEKIQLLQQRLEYLESTRKVAEECTNATDPSLALNLQSNQQVTKQWGEKKARQFEVNSVRSTVNSLAMDNYPFTEEYQVYPREFSDTNLNDFVIYEFMHIRMKG